MIDNEQAMDLYLQGIITGLEGAALIAETFSKQADSAALASQFATLPPLVQAPIRMAIQATARSLEESIRAAVVSQQQKREAQKPAAAVDLPPE